MAADPTGNEQIGLAVSEADGPFIRVGSDGLILRRDESIPWKNLRVCNPFVLERDGGWLMYYQGVGCPSGTHGSQKVTRTSIGLATSRDGITWEAERDPLLGPEALLPLDPRQSTAYTVGLIEPCVLEDATGLRMWFIYDHPSAVGNWLCLARSLDGRRWDLAPKPTLAGLDLSRFGDIRIHYPQVIPRDGRLELWFMARNCGTRSTASSEPYPGMAVCRGRTVSRSFLDLSSLKS